MKNFDEVKDIFEQMAITMNAVNSEEASDGNVTIDIDSVKLRYTRISEKDSFDTGLLVPVWDFIGTKQTNMDMRFKTQLLCPSMRLMVR